MIRPPYSEYDELYHKYFEDENCFIIKTPYKLYPIFHNGEEEDGYDVSAILSSNYQDLYLIFTGAFEFTLPHKVDAKYEWNCNINDNNIISKYKLILNKNRPDTTSLEFIKRSIENLENDYIVLTKEFDLNFYTHKTDNYSFEELDAEQLRALPGALPQSTQLPLFPNRKYNPDIEHAKNLSIYFAFPIPNFMAEWHQIELKSNFDYPLDKRSFTYPWQEFKSQFPCVFTVYRKNQRNSPILGKKMNPNDESLNDPSTKEVSSRTTFQLATQFGSLKEPNPLKRTKAPKIDHSLRPTLEVAPPIDFLSPTGNLLSPLRAAAVPAPALRAAPLETQTAFAEDTTEKEQKGTKKTTFTNSSLVPSFLKTNSQSEVGKANNK